MGTRRQITAVNLRDDLESGSTDPRPNDLPSFPGRSYFSLSLGYAQILISDEDVGPVLMGFLTIFGSLDRISGYTASQTKLSSRLDEVRTIRRHV